MITLITLTSASSGLILITSLWYEFSQLKCISTTLEIICVHDVVYLQDKNYPNDLKKKKESPFNAFFSFPFFCFSFQLVPYWEKTFRIDLSSPQIGVVDVEDVRKLSANP